MCSYEINGQEVPAKSKLGFMDAINTSIEYRFEVDGEIKIYDMDKTFPPVSIGGNMAYLTWSGERAMWANQVTEDSIDNTSKTWYVERALCGEGEWFCQFT